MGWGVSFLLEYLIYDPSEKPILFPDYLNREERHIRRCLVFRQKVSQSQTRISRIPLLLACNRSNSISRKGNPSIRVFLYSNLQGVVYDSPKGR